MSRDARKLEQDLKGVMLVWWACLWPCELLTLYVGCRGGRKRAEPGMERRARGGPEQATNCQTEGVYYSLILDYFNIHNSSSLVK